MLSVGIVGRGGSGKTELENKIGENWPFINDTGESGFREKRIFLGKESSIRLIELSDDFEPVETLDYILYVLDPEFIDQSYLNFWLNKTGKSPKTIFMIVVNKIDCYDNIDNIQKNNNLDYVYVSAKTGAGIDNLIDLLFLKKRV